MSRAAKVQKLSHEHEAGCHMLETIWPTLSPFLDLISSITVSKTCHTLRTLIVDPETKKIKVPHFSCACLDDVLESTLSTTADIVPVALNSIHFPSLCSVSIVFPDSTASEEDDAIEGAFASCFLQFATQLTYARKLRSLALQAQPMLQIGRQSYETQSFETLVLELFGQNLAICRDLAQLYIETAHVSFDSETMDNFMKAFLPTIKKDSLTDFVFNVFNSSESSDGGSSDLLDDSVPIQFYLALLSSRNLRTLELVLPMSTRQLKSLLKAAEQLKEPYIKPKELQNIQIAVNDCRFDEDSPSSRYLLNHFSECKHVNYVFFHFPMQMWNDGLDSVLTIAKNNPKFLALGFNGFNDVEGKALNFIKYCVKHTRIEKIDINHLHGVNGEELMIHLRKIGNLAKFELDGWTAEGRTGIKSQSIKIEVCGMISISSLRVVRDFS